MNRSQIIYAIALPIVVLAMAIAAGLVVYDLYERPAREAAELQQQMNAEHL